MQHEQPPPLPGRTNETTAAVVARNPRQPFVTVAQLESESERKAGQKVMKREEEQEMGKEHVGGGEDAGRGGNARTQQLSGSEM